MRALDSKAAPAWILFLLLAAGCGGGTPLTVDAGADQTVPLGAGVQLLAGAGEESREIRWEIEERPAGSVASIEEPTRAEARFTPDQVGSYVIKLVVREGGREGADTLTVSVLQNLPPVADAGGNRVVPVGTLVELDGRSSSDPEGQSLSFLWAFERRPAASEAALSNAASRTPSFTADEAGLYTLSLTVGDGARETGTTFTIRANQAPIADAGGDRPGTVGHRIQLEGSSSRDDDGDPLSYAWTVLSRPEGSTATLEAVAEVTTGFVPDVAGTYLVELVVSDGFADDAARATLQVLPASGVLGSVVFVAPTGSDSNPGSQEAPLATIAAAFAKVQQHEALYRIQLAAGLYEEDFSHAVVDGRLEVVGPETGVAELSGTGILFTVSGSTRLALSRVTLRSSVTAIKLTGSDAHAGLVEVTCRANECVSAMSGASVNVTDSQLSGTTAQSYGVRLMSGSSAVIIDSTFRTHGTAISVNAASLILRGSHFEESNQGLAVSGNAQSGQAVQVETCDFDGNQVAMHFMMSDQIRVVNSRVAPLQTPEGDLSRDGIRVSNSTVLLDRVTVTGLSGVNLLVESGSRVTIRRSDFEDGAGPGLIIDGQETIVDLGLPAQPGENALSGHSGVALLDRRTTGATGLISLSGTTLEGLVPPPGVYTGTSFTHGIRIMGVGNQVIAY